MLFANDKQKKNWHFEKVREKMEGIWSPFFSFRLWRCVETSQSYYLRKKKNYIKHTCAPSLINRKHISSAVYFAQTHLPNPALSAALFQTASGFKNKWRALPFIMFRTLFFPEAGMWTGMCCCSATAQRVKNLPCYQVPGKRPELAKQEDREIKWGSLRKAGGNA